jgi:spermidine/putrescine transport system ATP-binding protein
MVELRDVTKRFGTFEALKCASFEIKAGEFMTFLGPSGCGKTTCLRLISGFDAPTSGQILIDGRDVTFDPPYRRDVNQVFQNYALFPHLTIYENIAFGLRMKRVPAPEIKKRVERVIQMTSLEAFVDRKPAQMSGGQRQRISIARAFLKNAPILLLDEATSALDSESEKQIQLAFDTLMQGRTTIVIAHRFSTIRNARTIHVMQSGKVVASGSHQELISDEKSLYAHLYRLQYEQGVEIG